MPVIQDAPARKTTQETPSIQSLDRGLMILESVGKSSSPVSLGYLTGILGIDRSSVFRLANTLKRRGILTPPRTGKENLFCTSLFFIYPSYYLSIMLAGRRHYHRQG